MAHEARLASATNKFLDDEISATLYEELKQRIELEKKACLSKLDMLKTPKGADIEPQLEYAMSLINNMEHHIREGRLEVKRELIGVMFPEKFEFDGETYRTNSYNKVLDVIYLQTNELRGQKRRDSSDFSEKSLQVPPQVVPVMRCVQGQPDFWNMVWSWSSKNVASPNQSRNSLFYIIFSKYPLYDNILCILALIICLNLMLYNFYSRV